MIDNQIAFLTLVKPSGFHAPKTDAVYPLGHLIGNFEINQGLLHNIIRTITWNKKFSHVNHLYKQLEILKYSKSMCTNWNLQNLCINFLTINYRNYGNKILLKLNKFTPTKLGGLTNLTIFSLVFSKLLVNINSNIEELNYGTILVKN